MQKKQSKKSSRQKSYRDIDEELGIIENMSEIRKNQLRNHNYKVNGTFKTKKQKEMFNEIMKNRITFVKGSPGTGKTYIALMAGLELLKNQQINIDQIILTKPIVEIASRSIGALPGDLNLKTLSYYTHFYDNLSKLVGNEVTKYLKETESIKETLLNFLRGSTFGRYDGSGNPIGSYCVADEFQNTTTTEMKTFISRMGENSKLVILGDLDQTDLKFNRGEKSGLQDAWDRLQGIDGIGFVEFSEDDIVRDPLLIQIMKRYKD